MSTGGWSFKQRIEQVIKEDQRHGHLKDIEYVWIQATRQQMMFLLGNKIATEDDLKSLPATFKSRFLIEQQVIISILFADRGMRNLVDFMPMGRGVLPITRYPIDGISGLYRQIIERVENSQLHDVEMVRIHPSFAPLFLEFLPYDRRNEIPTFVEALKNRPPQIEIPIVMNAYKEFTVKVDDRSCPINGHLIATIDKNDRVVGEDEKLISKEVPV